MKHEKQLKNENLNTNHKTQNSYNEKYKTKHHNQNSINVKSKT